MCGHRLASSAGRAYSAAVLFVLPLGMLLFEPVPPDISPAFWLFVGVQLVLAIALAARRSWARAAALGMMTSFLMQWMIRPEGVDPFHIVTHELAVLAFVVPWSRRDVSRPALVLALQAIAYASASSAFNMDVSSLGDELLAPTCEAIALGVALAACVGTVLRARWSAYASAVSALALFGVVGELLVSHSALDTWLASQQQLVLSAVGTGAIAAAIATVLGLRTMHAPPVRLGA